MPDAPDADDRTSFDEIEWSGAGKTHSQRGTYLNVLRKESDGAWRISHHMWDDPAPQVR